MMAPPPSSCAPNTPIATVHSCNYGGVVRNPLWTLVHLLATMKNDRGEITIDGFHDDIVRPTPEERNAAARLPLDLEEIKQTLGISRLDAPAGPTRRIFSARLPRTCGAMRPRSSSSR